MPPKKLGKMLGANRGSRPSTDGPPHARFPTMYCKGHIINSIESVTVFFCAHSATGKLYINISHPGLY